MAEFAELPWRAAGAGEAGAAPPDRRSSKRQEPAARQAALLALRELVGASLHLALRDKSRCQDDRFLERFLWARKHDAREAFRLLLAHYGFRQRQPELFRELSAADPAVARALADVLPGVLRERDRRGRCVLVLFAANWSPGCCPLSAVFRALLLTLETALDDVQNQANGFVVVVDWTEFSFKQSASMHPRVLKLMIEGLQDCYPARFKGIHFIGQPWYVETALAVIKPFLRGKTKERIRLHGNNLSTLHEHVARDILPSDLGGEGPAHNAQAWLARLRPPPAAPPDPPGPRAPPDEPPLGARPGARPGARLDKGYKRAEAPGAGAGLLLPDEDP